MSAAAALAKYVETNVCLTCPHLIDFKAERNYIVYDEQGKERRQCARCYDKEHGRAYNRRFSTDAVIGKL